MSEETKPTEAKKPEEVKPNQFSHALSNDLKEEYEETKAQYKAAKAMAKTVHERTTVMRMYQDSLIDYAVESRILQDWALNTQINQEIDALTRRLSTGRRGW
jgi:hypothetical protein